MKMTIEYADGMSRNDVALRLWAPSLAVAIEKFDGELRDRAKHQDQESITIDDARDLLRECLNDAEVPLWLIWR